MNWTVPNTESLLRRLTKPKGKIDVVLDTDTYNELDDQFALSYMIKNSDKLNVKALYAAPFLNDKSVSPKDGMEKSYDEILKLLTLLKQLIIQHDMTVISITHDPVELSMSDYAVVLDHGKVAMQGATAELLKESAKLAQMHLALPFAQRLQLQLKERGISVPTQYLDSERMVEWLCQQLNS